MYCTCPTIPNIDKFTPRVEKDYKDKFRTDINENTVKSGGQGECSRTHMLTIVPDK